MHVHYGAVHALRGVTMHVNEGEIVTLIGANGAGKSTLMNCIFGVPRPSAGDILFEGQSITKVVPHLISRLGIALSPEGRRIFARMTVAENLQTGAIHADASYWQQDLDRIFAMFPILEKRRDQRAGTLSGGEQQMLAIGRALVSRPRLLLLDEPSLGLAPIYIQKIFQTVTELNRDHGMTIMLVEQNAHHALKVAHRAYVLQHGEIVLTGSGQELLSSPEVRDAYLAGAAAAS
jgi:branched-chain amino acid transport system ATP-binding protein